MKKKIMIIALLILICIGISIIKKTNITNNSSEEHKSEQNKVSYDIEKYTTNRIIVNMEDRDSSEPSLIENKIIKFENGSEFDM